MAAPVRTIRSAVSFINKVGIASLFPMSDLALPSLWQAVAGTERIDWAVRDDEGNFSAWSPEFAKAWGWKSELPERKLVCVGKHFGSWVAMISLDALPSVYALSGLSVKVRNFDGLELSPLEKDLAEAVHDLGPKTVPQLRDVVQHDRKKIAGAVDRLQRMKVLTAAGALDTGRGWPALTYDLLVRRYSDRLRKIPKPETARVAIAKYILKSERELSAADLAAIVRWKRAEAESTLDRLVEEGDATTTGEDRMRLWTPR